MLPMCADMGVGCAPYSPQGEGRLSRFWGTQIDRSGVDVRWLRLGSTATHAIHRTVGGRQQLTTCVLKFPEPCPYGRRPSDSQAFPAESLAVPHRIGTC